MSNAALNAADIVFLLLDAAGGSIIGRTVLQKILYFASVKEHLPLNFRPHYYGPYSAEVTGALDDATAAGLIREQVDSYATTGLMGPSSRRRYTYSIEPGGEEIVLSLIRDHKVVRDNLIALVARCQENSNLDPKTLSWAAKVHFITTNEGRPMTHDEIRATARDFHWQISPLQVESAEQILRDLALLTS
jgi:hypothetical protein